MNSMHEAYIKARMNVNEEEGFNELAEIIETGIAQASLVYNMGLLELCEKGLYDKIRKKEKISVSDLPSFVWKEICQEIGAKILESCTLDYAFADDDEEKRDVRIRAVMVDKNAK